MTDSPNVLAFDVGMNVIRYALFTNGRQGIPGTIAMPAGKAESFYETLAGVANRCQDAGTGLSGIAISMPGFIDTTHRKAITAGPLAMLNGRGIGQELVEYLDHSVPIWVENDANCAAIAEKCSGNARTLDDFVVITVDTGIGGAVFLNGHLLRGRDWNAGELGMMITNFDVAGPLPLHDFASTIALRQRYAEEFGVPEESVVASTLLRRLDEPRVREVVERWADYVAILIYNTVVVLNPECVLIGGQISQESALMPLIKDALLRIPTWKKSFRVPVKRCRHSGNASLMGAYYAFLNGTGHEEGATGEAR